MKHPIWITIILITMFIIAQVFGLFVFSKYMNVVTKMPNKNTPIGQIQSNELKDFNWQFIIIIVCAILIGTGICLYLIRSQKFNLLRLWVGTALFVNLLIAMGAFYPIIIAITLATILTAARLLLTTWKHYQYLHNATELMLYGGFATLFAFVLNVWAVVILLIIVSIYDMIAVWKSKHMIIMAKGLIKNNIFSGLLINYKGKKAILGGGDIAFPLLASVVILRNFGWSAALCVIAGSTAALITLFAISRKGKFYPAMPYLSAGTFIGMLAGWLI